MVQFSKIFKQAFGILKKHRFLWSFGLFLVLGNLLFGWLNSPDSELNYQGGGLVALLVGGVLLFIVYFRSKASLVIAIHAILEKKDTSFAKAFAYSQLFYSKILGIYFMLELGLIALGLILGSPIQYLFEHHYMIRGIILLVLGSIIFLPLMILVLLINILAPMFVVIYDLSIRESIERSFELVQKYWLNIGTLGFLLFLLEVPALFLGAIMIGLRGGWVFIIFGIIAFLIIESMVAVFQQAAWVLVFLDLVKPQKFEQAEPVEAPEVVQ